MYNFANVINHAQNTKEIGVETMVIKDNSLMVLNKLN